MGGGEGSLCRGGPCVRTQYSGRGGSPVPTRSFFVQFDPFGAVCSVVSLYPGVRFAHTPAKHGWTPSGPACPRRGTPDGWRGGEPV